MPSRGFPESPGRRSDPNAGVVCVRDPTHFGDPRPRSRGATGGRRRSARELGQGLALDLRARHSGRGASGRRAPRRGPRRRLSELPRDSRSPRLLLDLRDDFVASPADRDDFEDRMSADRRRRVRTQGKPLTEDALGGWGRHSYLLLSRFERADARPFQRIPSRIRLGSWGTFGALSIGTRWDP
jgi:hypothetical protein